VEPIRGKERPISLRKKKERGKSRNEGQGRKMVLAQREPDWEGMSLGSPNHREGVYSIEQEERLNSGAQRKPSCGGRPISLRKGNKSPLYDVFLWLSQIWGKRGQEGPPKAQKNRKGALTKGRNPVGTGAGTGAEGGPPPPPPNWDSVAKKKK